MSECLAERLFTGSQAEAELEDVLDKAGVPYENLGWDGYDASVEIRGVPADYRLTNEAQQAIFDAGFSKAYVNHVDKWETHYTYDHRDAFKASDGWRVSYPHKRDDGKPGIWVEKHIPSWPKEWFDSGYVQIKATA